MELDAGRRKFLETELELVKERIKREWYAADYLVRELRLAPLPPLDDLFGNASPDSALGKGGNGRPQLGANQEPADLVNDGEFAGRSATKATKLLMDKTGRTRPLKLAEIYRAITKGGVQISSHQVLFKSLARSKEFCRPGRKGSGLWALSEWYSAPELRRMSQRSGTDSEVDVDLDAAGDDLDSDKHHDEVPSATTTATPEVDGQVA